MFSSENVKITFPISNTICMTVSVSADDLPELQEVQDDQSTPGVFQVALGMSHHEEGLIEGRSSRPEGNVSHTNWLTELANIATSPQSPLLQDAPHNRSGNHGIYTIAHECKLQSLDCSDDAFSL